MKTLILILLLVGINCELLGQKTPTEPSPYPDCLIYGGVNSPLLRTSNFVGLQTGIRYYPEGTIPLFLGLENIYCYGQNHYTWPEVGDYVYKRNYYCLSPLVGVTLFRKYRFNDGYAIRFNFASFKGSLETENQQIKEYVNNYYKGHHYGFGFSKYISYKINNKLAIYADLTYFKIHKEVHYFLFGIGLNYSFIRNSN